MSIIQELKRRNVTRVAAAYIVGAWLVVQIAVSIFPAFDLDHWTRLVIIGLAAGFVPVVIFSWVFEWTPAGFKRDEDVLAHESIAPTTARRLDKVIVVTLVLALGYFVVDKFVFSASREAAIAKSAREAGRIEAKLGTYDKSIAVLPFANRSTDAENEYFSDGVSAEILSLLARNEELRVVSRASSFSFKGQELTVAEMAEQLNVAYVLDGSVRMKGGNVRLSVQLIDVETDTNVWSEVYNRELKDVFEVQDDIARQVATAMHITLVRNFPRSVVTTAEAYVTYLKGDFASKKGTQEGMNEALEWFAKAIEEDPTYPLVRINRANVYAIQAARGFIPYDEGFTQAIEAADEAYELDPDLSSSMRGWIAMMYERDYEVAARLLKQAIAYKPNDPSILNNSAVLANVLGRTPRAIELMKDVAEIAPRSPIPQINLATWYADIGDFSAAERYALEAIDKNPDIFGAPMVLARLPLQQGEPELALERAPRIKQPFFREVVEIAALHDTGQTEQARRRLRAMEEAHADEWAYFIAMVYAHMGEPDRAFEWLDRAISEKQNIIALRTDALFGSLRQDDRWQDTLQRMGLADHQISAVVF